MHVPPLLYAPALQSKVEAALVALPGVWRVVCDRHRARLSVFYDRHAFPPSAGADRPLIRAVRDASLPYLERMEPDPFAERLGEQDAARRERLQGKLAQGTYLTLLGWAHWHVFRWALRNPTGAWWAWALLGFGIYTHRRQIRRIPEL
jgi:hypothetical protein